MQRGDLFSAFNQRNATNVCFLNFVVWVTHWKHICFFLRISACLHRIRTLKDNATRKPQYSRKLQRGPSSLLRTALQANVGDVRGSVYRVTLKDPMHSCRPLHKPRPLVPLLPKRVTQPTCQLHDDRTRNPLTGMTSDGWTRSVWNVALYTGSWNALQPQEAATLARYFRCAAATETYDFRLSPPHLHNFPTSSQS